MYDQLWVEPDDKDFIDYTKCIRCEKEAIGNTGVCKECDTSVGRPTLNKTIIRCRRCNLESLRVYTAKYCLKCMRIRSREARIKKRGAV